MPSPARRLVLDSDTLSFALRKDVGVRSRMQRAIAEEAELYLCPVVYYEVRRGLLDKNAIRQMKLLDELVEGALLWRDVDAKCGKRRQSFGKTCDNAVRWLTTLISSSRRSRKR